MDMIIGIEHIPPNCWKAATDFINRTFEGGYDGVTNFINESFEGGCDGVKIE